MTRTQTQTSQQFLVEYVGRNGRRYSGGTEWATDALTAAENYASLHSLGLPWAPRKDRGNVVCAVSLAHFNASA